jgi:hypothetical protein
MPTGTDSFAAVLVGAMASKCTLSISCLNMFSSTPFPRPVFLVSLTQQLLDGGYQAPNTTLDVFFHSIVGWSLPSGSAALRKLEADQIAANPSNYAPRIKDLIRLPCVSQNQGDSRIDCSGSHSYFKDDNFEYLTSLKPEPVFTKEERETLDVEDFLQKVWIDYEQRKGPLRDYVDNSTEDDSEEEDSNYTYDWGDDEDDSEEEDN